MLGPKDPIEQLAFNDFVETEEDENQVEPNKRMANENAENKEKTEMKKVSQEFMENLKAIGRISGYYFFYWKLNKSGKKDSWIKYVCGCYQPSQEEALLLMPLDGQCLTIHFNIVFITFFRARRNCSTELQ